MLQTTFLTSRAASLLRGGAKNALIVFLFASGCHGCPACDFGFDGVSSCEPVPGSVCTSCVTRSDCNAGLACEDGTCVDTSCPFFGTCVSERCFPPDAIDAGARAVRDAGTDAEAADASFDAGPPIHACPSDVDPCWQACIDTGVPTLDCASTCPVGDGYGCYALCNANGDTTIACVVACGVMGDGARVGCGEACQRNEEGAFACRRACGLDGPCGELACAETCIAHDDPFDTCSWACGFETELGMGACFTPCTAAGETLTTCIDRCGGAGTPCGESGCWAACTSAGEELARCRESCGASTPCGRARCYQQCELGTEPFTNCLDTCGVGSGTCDCLLDITVADACKNACGALGGTSEECLAQCGE